MHSHGTAAVVAAFDPTSSALLSGDFDGVLRVGSVTDAEPHVLFATSPVSLAISPDGRWVAVGGDKVLQLWPFPDTSRPPLHTLPHDQLLAKLRSFTNLRVLPDDESTTGFSIRIEESPGWDGVPTW